MCEVQLWNLSKLSYFRPTGITNVRKSKVCFCFSKFLGKKKTHNKFMTTMLRVYCVLNFTISSIFFLCSSLWSAITLKQKEIEAKWIENSQTETQLFSEMNSDCSVIWKSEDLQGSQASLCKVLTPMNSALSEMSAPTYFTQTPSQTNIQILSMWLRKKFLEVVISWTKVSFLLVIAKSVSCFHIKYCSYRLYTGPVKIKQVQIFRMIYMYGEITYNQLKHFKSTLCTYIK